MVALKEWFDVAFYRGLAEQLARVEPSVDAELFYRQAVADLEERELKDRLRHTAELCRAHLPTDYRQAVAILREVVPCYDGEFRSMFCPEFVGLYGLDDFDFSLEALAYFTPFGSSEFAVRPFLRRDLARGLALMLKWASDENEHLRRLASEGCRPRLPWSFNLSELIRDPAPIWPILDALKTDASLYVRKSVANNLNDISKDHAEWMLEKIAGWDLDHEHSAWIARHAARTLIKAGHPGSFALLGFAREPQLALERLELSAPEIALGEALSFSFALKSKKDVVQKLAVDFAVHYVKKAGHTTAKVFKLKELELAPGREIVLKKAHKFCDYSTRKHYPGEHAIEVFVNGRSLACASFMLCD
jgi:3-methyladenine DNA glycosylase AlkC